MSVSAGRGVCWLYLSARATAEWEGWEVWLSGPGSQPDGACGACRNVFDILKWYNAQILSNVEPLRPEPPRPLKEVYLFPQGQQRSARIPSSSNRISEWPTFTSINPLSVHSVGSKQLVRNPGHLRFAKRLVSAWAAWRSAWHSVMCPEINTPEPRLHIAAQHS